MPDMSRATGGSLKARLRRHRFRISAPVGALMLLPTVAAAQDAVGSLLASPYLAAFARLQQHEIAALALILGVVFFAVVTAILLVRTHAQASASARA